MLFGTERICSSLWDARRPRAEAATAAVQSTYVISLPHSEGRRMLLEPVLKRHASNVTYVQPFDGRKQQAESAVRSWLWSCVRNHVFMPCCNPGAACTHCGVSRVQIVHSHVQHAVRIMMCSMHNAGRLASQCQCGGLPALQHHAAGLLQEHNRRPAVRGHVPPEGMRLHAAMRMMHSL